MQQSIALLLGFFIICIYPLLFLAAGIWYARHGFPISVQWRGWRREEEDHGDPL